VVGDISDQLFIKKRAEDVIKRYSDDFINRMVNKLEEINGIYDNSPLHLALYIRTVKADRYAHLPPMKIDQVGPLLDMLESDLSEMPILLNGDFSYVAELRLEVNE